MWSCRHERARERRAGGGGSPGARLDLGVATFRGERFSWTSKLGHIDWQGDFCDSFGGGLLFTCGLRNVGVPSEGHPQHGLVHVPRRARRAPRERSARAWARGGRDARARARDSRRAEPRAGQRRREERGDAVEAAPFLYHVNLRWDAVDIDSAEVVPRDDDARAGDWRSHGPPGPERVYEHLGATRAVVTVGTVRVTVTLGGAAPLAVGPPRPTACSAIEPANCSRARPGTRPRRGPPAGARPG